MSDTLFRRKEDEGYIIGWRHRWKHEAGHFDEEMTFGEATAKAEQMSAGDADKIFWAARKTPPQAGH